MTEKASPTPQACPPGEQQAQHRGAPSWLLTPAGLKAWQATLRRRGTMQRFNEQDAGNALLSWGTLTASDPRLAAAADKRLAMQLLQHTMELTDRGAFTPRYACEVL